jgi:hypothetical protein
VADRKQERERLREIRREAEAREAREQRRRLLLGYGVAGILGAAVLVGIVIVIVSGGGGSGGVTEDSFINSDSGDTNGVPPDDREGTPPPTVEVTNLRQAARQAGCELRLNLPDEGNTHIPPGSEAPPYKTTPPTSGDHVEAPFQQADGAYSEMPDPISIVHSLEHGRMEIQYSPDLPEADQLELKGLYATIYGATILFPNPQMSYEVAATTWTNLIGCNSYRGAATLDAIRAFGRVTWGRFGGEPAEAFPFTGPTPANPEP